MRQFLITEQLAQNILNYLAEKPFKESAGLINSLQRLVPYEEPKEQDEPPKEEVVEEKPNDDKGN